MMQTQDEHKNTEIISKTLYSKTNRISDRTWEWLLTEKLDGSNLCFFTQDGVLQIAQRKKIIPLPVARENAHLLYNGLLEWLDDNGDHLQDAICEGAVICGEWLGMGVLKYPEDFLRFNMFAKARITDELELYSLDYDPDDFKWAFTSRMLPDYISIVPIIGHLNEPPHIAKLDEIYANYLARVNRDVEGIVVTQRYAPPFSRAKYVRMKRGHLTPHAEKGD